MTGSPLAALARFHGNIASGAIVGVPVDWADVASIGERLSAQYTWTEGYRGFDVLHVATALHLGAREFLSFDGRQKAWQKQKDSSSPGDGPSCGGFPG